MEKAMAAHSSTPAWKIPWTEESGGLQSMGSLRVGHNLATSLSHFTFMHWRRKWQPTPVFLPGESYGWGSLVGCHLWGHTESDTTEAPQQQQQHYLGSPLYFSSSEIKLSTDQNKTQLLLCKRNDKNTALRIRNHGSALLLVWCDVLQQLFQLDSHCCCCCFKICIMGKC